MLRRRGRADGADEQAAEAGEETSPAPEDSGDAAETLAASVVLLKQSVVDLRALTDEDALDLRAHMRTLEQRLDLMEARLEQLADTPQDQSVVSSDARQEAEATAASRGDSERDAARAYKAEMAKRKMRAMRKRAARGAAASATPDEKDEQPSDA